MAQIRRRRRMLKRTCPFAAESLEKLERLRQLVYEMRNELDEYKYFDAPGAGISMVKGLGPGGDPEVAKKQQRAQMRQQSLAARADIERPNIAPSRLKAMRAKLKAKGLLGKTDDVPAVHKPSGMRIMIRGARAT